MKTLLEFLEYEKLDASVDEYHDKMVEFIEDLETKNTFIEEVYELAFGDNAINRAFSHKDVLQELRRFSDNSLRLIDAETLLISQYNSIDDFEQAKKDYFEGPLTGEEKYNRAVEEYNQGHISVEELQKLYPEEEE